MSSAENIADICTRKDSLLKNLGPDSRWQRGPDWLSRPRHQWPCSREFTHKDLPAEETKSPIRVVLAAKNKEVITSSLVKFAMEEHWNFTQAAFSLARSISRIKILRRMFVPSSNCQELICATSQRLSISRLWTVIPPSLSPAHSLRPLGLNGAVQNIPARCLDFRKLEKAFA